MADKTQTYKLSFQASVQGLEQVRKELDNLLKTPNLNISNRLKDSLKEIETLFRAFQSQFQREMAKTSVDEIDTAGLEKQFKTIATKLQSAFTSVSKSNLTEDLNQELDALIKKLNEARSRLGGLKSGRNRNAAKLDETGNIADASLRNSIFHKQTKAVTGSPGITYEDDKGNVKTIESLEELVSLMDKFKDGTYQTKATFEQLSQVVDNTRVALGEAAAEIQTKIAAYDAPTGDSSIAQATQDVEDAKTAIEEFKQAQQNANGVTQQEAAIIDQAASGISKLSQLTGEVSDATDEATKREQNFTKTQQDNTQAVEQNTKTQQRNSNTLVRAAQNVLSYGTAIRLLRTAYHQTLTTITDLDKALTNMAVVTRMSREQTWELVGSFQALARQTGQTSSEIAGIATKFYQQGKSTTQVLQLTEAAAKAATIAGIDGARSVDLLTNALNGFQMAASQAMEVSDKFAALAASAATNYEELAVALSKVAAQANLAGLSMDFTLGLLTKGIETTRKIMRHNVVIYYVNSLNLGNELAIA